MTDKIGSLPAISKLHLFVQFRWDLLTVTYDRLTVKLLFFYCVILLLNSSPVDISSDLSLDHHVSRICAGCYY